MKKNPNGQFATSGSAGTPATPPIRKRSRAAGDTDGTPSKKQKAKRMKAPIYDQSDDDDEALAVKGEEEI